MGDVVDGDRHTLYPLSSFSYVAKEPMSEKHGYNRLALLKVKYEEESMRTSVAGVLLVQEHSFPHILVLEIGGKFCKLPGGRLKSGEDEVEGLKRKLTRKLCSDSLALQTNWQMLFAKEIAQTNELPTYFYKFQSKHIGKCIGMWWRPNFEYKMYPYCPAHIKKPKECRKVFLVHLSEGIQFAIPSNLKLLARPFFEVYYNAERYGPIIASIPIALSGYQFNFSLRNTE